MVDPALWNLDRPVIALPGDRHLSLRDFYEACLILGSPGSGKTSSSYFTMLQGLLTKTGAGGIFFCAKPGDGAMYQKWCRMAGRERDVIVVSTDSRHQFDIFRYLMMTTRVDIENLVELPFQLMSVIERDENGSASDPYWPRAAKEALRMATSALLLAGWPVNLRNLQLMIDSAPRKGDLHKPEWQAASFNCRCIDAAVARSRSGEADPQELRRVGRFWMHSWPVDTPEKTRGGIVKMISGVTSVFLQQGILRDLLCSDGMTFAPELSEQGALIIVDLPSLEEHVFALAQIVLKWAWQKALLRRLKRRDDGPMRPVILAIDEAQTLYTDDHRFLQVSRGAACISLYVSQNIPGFEDAIGGSSEARTRIENYLGNVGIIVSHQQRDARTREFLAELIGKGLQNRNGMSMGENAGGFEHFSMNSSEQMDYHVQPADLARLRRGGPENDFWCGSYLIANRFSAEARPWLKVEWPQPPRFEQSSSH